jgi:hypothetical protein
MNTEMAQEELPLPMAQDSARQKSLAARPRHNDALSLGCYRVLRPGATLLARAGDDSLAFIGIRGGDLVLVDRSASDTEDALALAADGTLCRRSGTEAGQRLPMRPLAGRPVYKIDGRKSIKYIRKPTYSTV